MRQLGVALLLLFSLGGRFAALGQDAASPSLVFEGKPLALPVSCSEDDMQSLGMACSAEAPCPVFLELSSMEAIGNRLVVAGNLHTDAATLSSILLVSEDSGKTWVEGHSRIPNAALDQMQFVDLTTGWVAGQIIGALPRDPFFLLTTDGGKTWKQRPVFGDSHLGSIEKFLFKGPTEGVVLVDRAQSGEGGRYALLETRTGADSWNILSITTAVPANVRFDRAPSAAWRLQAHAPSKSYRIERREGQRWTMVGSFLVNTGYCKPEAFELKEPPPPPTPETDAVSEIKVVDPTKKKQAPTLKKKP